MRTKNLPSPGAAAPGGWCCTREFATDSGTWLKQPSSQRRSGTERAGAELGFRSQGSFPQVHQADSPKEDGIFCSLYLFWGWSGLTSRGVNSALCRNSRGKIFRIAQGRPNSPSYLLKICENWGGTWGMWHCWECDRTVEREDVCLKQFKAE